METGLLNHVSRGEHSAVLFARKEVAILFLPAPPRFLQTLQSLNPRADRDSAARPRRHFTKELFWPFAPFAHQVKLSGGSRLLLTSVLRVSAGALCKEYSFPEEGLVSRVTQSISTASCLPSPGCHLFSGSGRYFTCLSVSL